jgi:hypothetical protein
LLLLLFAPQHALAYIEPPYMTTQGWSAPARCCAVSHSPPEPTSSHLQPPCPPPCCLSLPRPMHWQGAWLHVGSCAVVACPPLLASTRAPSGRNLRLSTPGEHQPSPGINPSRGRDLCFRTPGKRTPALPWHQPKLGPRRLYQQLQAALPVLFAAPSLGGCAMRAGFDSMDFRPL